MEQFLKFQAFAEQLTKETQDLKVKIESHKRENRHLTALIDQQKDDAARLTLRLSGTERQRDDALEALVLQQEIAEKLERERKRNLKELAALQHTNKAIIRQRDESQRVVVHLRSLINGQTHHMEHIVRSLNKAPELSDYVENGTLNADGTSGEVKVNHENTEQDMPTAPEEPRRSLSRASTVEGLDAEKVHPDMEKSFFSSLVGDGSKRANRLSIADVADRHLRDKTDAIADIIRNISEQCAAAVEGLQMAHDADEGDLIDDYKSEEKGLAVPEEDNDRAGLTDGSEAGEGASENDSSYLNPSGRNSSIPPTPDLVHNRSSTSMSNMSQSTGPDRGSGQYSVQQGDTPTKIMGEDTEIERASDAGQSESGVVSKNTDTNILRPVTARTISSRQ